MAYGTDTITGDKFHAILSTAGVPLGQGSVQDKNAEATEEVNAETTEEVSLKAANSFAVLKLEQQ